MAKLLTGISGNLISAASAGYAPTNSSDVSAIASAYQVVSATATQLYAGTAYVTSVNGAPLSASRAGNAANASMANSAYYDGTGRLISALPDSAAVSAIASAYAESAASGKQDELDFSYDENDRIDAINGSALAGQGGGGGGVDSATVSAIASSYAESAASSKVDLYNVNGINITAKGLAISGASGIIARYGNSMAVLQTYPLQRMYLTDQGTNKGVYTYLSGISGNGGGTWQYGTAEYGKLTSVYDTVSGNSATWGAGGVDSATVSAIASSYAESAVSSYQPLSGMSSYASAFSAGEGLEFVQSGSDQVLQVEAPVDIVAGPGIHIDNPDGNTLRVSVAQAEEVELYKHTTVATTNVNDVFTMSEPITNFERIRIDFWSREFQYHRISFEYTVIDAVADSTQFIAALDASLGTSNIQRVNMAVGFNSAGNLVDKGHGLFFGNGSSYTNAANRGLGIHRVVGIHRINGGN